MHSTRRALTTAESHILGLVRDLYGPANDDEAVFINERGEAEICARDRDGAPVMAVVLTNIAGLQQTSHLSDQEVMDQWLRREPFSVGPSSAQWRRKRIREDRIAAICFHGVLLAVAAVACLFHPFGWVAAGVTVAGVCALYEVMRRSSEYNAFEAGVTCVVLLIVVLTAVAAVQSAGERAAQRERQKQSSSALTGSAGPETAQRVHAPGRGRTALAEE